MEIMDSSILFENELLNKKKAKCPKCESGEVKPVFPGHKQIWDYACDKCGYKIHFEPMVIVE